MNTLNDNLVGQLEEILEKNRDAEKGYEKAAENANSISLQSFFRRKSAERKQFNQELKEKMVNTYDEVDDSGSFTGTVHRAWMDVKAMFSANDDESMLEEAIKGDKAAVEEYEEILQETNLPLEISQCISRQKAQIQDDLNKVKSLEDLE